MLLSRGLEPNTRSNDGSTSLHYAASIPNSADRTEILEILLDAGANPGVQRSDGNLPIHVIFSAAPFQSEVELLPRDMDGILGSLSKGFADRRNKNQETALHLVCKCGVERYGSLSGWISLMLDHGYDSLIENDDGQSSLSILLAGFEFENSRRRDGPLAPPPPGCVTRMDAIETSLQIVLGRLHYRSDDIPPEIRTIAARILSLGIKYSLWGLCEQSIKLVNDTSEQNLNSMESPLLSACSRPNLEQTLLQTIVSKASDFTRYDKDGYTALHKAVMMNRLQTVIMLVSLGADVNQREENKRGMTPLIQARLTSKTGERIAQYLIASGANVSLRTTDGYSPIHQICFDGALDVLKLVPWEEIIAAGRIDFLQKTFQSEYRWNDAGCFQLAVIGGRLDVVSFLLARGSNVNEATEKDLVTALHIAAHNGRIPVAKYLIRAGADVNLKNALGETPFHTALRTHQVDMLHYLLESGALLSGETKSMVWMEVISWNNVRVRHILKGAFGRAFQSQVSKWILDLVALFVLELLNVD
jgi:ankyrin repeat protein